MGFKIKSFPRGLSVRGWGGACAWMGEGRETMKAKSRSLISLFILLAYLVERLSHLNSSLSSSAMLTSAKMSDS